MAQLKDLLVQGRTQLSEQLIFKLENNNCIRFGADSTDGLWIDAEPLLGGSDLEPSQRALLINPEQRRISTKTPEDKYYIDEYVLKTNIVEGLPYEGLTYSGYAMSTCEVSLKTKDEFSHSNATSIIIPGQYHGRKCYIDSSLSFSSGDDANNTIHTIIVSEGVGTIASGAFANFDALTTLVLPASLQSLGTGLCLGTSSQPLHVYYAGSQLEWNMLKLSAGESGVFAPGRTIVYHFDVTNDPIKLVSTIASSGGGYSSGLSYELISSPDGSDTYKITGIGTCIDIDLVLPSKYNNTPVTAIADSAFKDNSKILSITFPNSITSFGEGICENCTNLQQINFPTTMTTIPKYMFKGCSKLQTVTIPKEIETISEEAFCDCIALSTLILSKNLTLVKSKAFAVSDISISCPPVHVYYEGSEQEWLGGYSIIQFADGNQRIVSSEALHYNFAMSFEVIYNTYNGAREACAGYDIGKGTIEERLTRLGFHEGVITPKNGSILHENSFIKKQGNYVLCYPQFNYCYCNTKNYRTYDDESGKLIKIGPIDLGVIPQGFRPLEKQSFSVKFIWIDYNGDWYYVGPPANTRLTRRTFDNVSSTLLSSETDAGTASFSVGEYYGSDCTITITPKGLIQFSMNTYNEFVPQNFPYLWFRDGIVNTVIGYEAKNEPIALPIPQALPLWETGYYQTPIWENVLPGQFTIEVTPQKNVNNPNEFYTARLTPTPGYCWENTSDQEDTVDQNTKELYWTIQDIDTIFQDFDYTWDKSANLVYLNYWKGTTNGVNDTHVIVPNNPRIRI